MLAVDNILSLKKWDTGEFEKNNIDGFISVEKKINDNQLFLKNLRIKYEFDIG